MRYRSIVVPKNKNAESDLDFDNTTSDQIFTIQLSENDFKFLYEEGIFDRMNKTSNSLIDDYEDSVVNNQDHIKKIKLELLNLLNNYKNEKHNLIKKILNLFELAEEKKTGVYFYF